MAIWKATIPEADENLAIALFPLVTSRLSRARSRSPEFTESMIDIKSVLSFGCISLLRLMRVCGKDALKIFRECRITSYNVCYTKLLRITNGTGGYPYNRRSPQRYKSGTGGV